ncbi:MAG: hypothetical protein AB7V46_18025 [Thermomicrobiales bacterium]
MLGRGQERPAWGRLDANDHQFILPGASASPGLSTALAPEEENLVQRTASPSVLVHGAAMVVPAVHLVNGLFGKV